MQDLGILDISSDEETAHVPVKTHASIEFKIILEAVQAFQKSFGENFTNPIKVEDGSSGMVGHVIPYIHGLLLLIPQPRWIELRSVCLYLL